VSDRTRGVVACAVTLAATLAGCGGPGPVAVDAPVTSGGDRAACTAFLAALPQRLAGQERRPVTPDDAPVAAWGDPAITVTCGVGPPAGFDRFSACQVADGVGWFVPPAQVDDQDADATLTAAGYRPRVALHLPADYRPEGAAAAVTGLSGPVKRHLERVRRCH
jgi:uncharacterized protein DUF3515